MCCVSFWLISESGSTLSRFSYVLTFCHIKTLKRIFQNLPTHQKCQNLSHEDMNMSAFPNIQVYFICIVRANCVYRRSASQRGFRRF